MKNFIIFFCLVLWTNITYAQQVTVTGVGDNKDDAIKDAFRNAVEQVVGVYVNSNTVVSNSQVEFDKIYANSEGYVNDFKVLRTAYKGEDCQVQVCVDIDTEPSSKLLRDLKLTYMLDNPRIMVKVSGGNYAGICEAAVVRKLREMGLDVVATKSTLQENIAASDVIVNNDLPNTDGLPDEAESDGQSPQEEYVSLDSVVEIGDGQGMEDFSENVPYGDEVTNGDVSDENQPIIEDSGDRQDDDGGITETNITNRPGIVAHEQGSMQALSDWGMDELEKEFGEYTVRCILSESSTNVTLPNFYVAGKNNKTTNNTTGLYKGIANANVDVVKNSTRSVIQQFYLTDTKIYNSADIAKQMAVEGISQQIANQVAEIFSHHAKLVKVNG